MKKRIAQFIIKNLTSKDKRHRQVVNWNQAKLVGILFYADSEPVIHRVNQFARDLNDQGISTEICGYVNRKELLDFHRKFEGIKFFSNKTVTWYGRPKDFSVNKFIAREFSILIDLNLQERLTTKYITGRSQAHFKVGSSANSMVDLMIAMEEKGDVDQLIIEIQKYVGILSPSKK